MFQHYMYFGLIPTIREIEQKELLNPSYHVKRIAD